MFISAILALTASVAAPPADQNECSRLVLLLLDGTGSFKEHREAAVGAGVQKLAGLEGGACFTARSIRGQSFGADNDVVPLVRFPRPRTRIDPAHRRAVLRMKQAAATELKTYIGDEPAGTTDFWQALYAAAFTFRTTPAGVKELYVYSDLLDNRRLRSNEMPLRLEGVDVHLVVPRRSADMAQAFEARLEIWQDIFRETGATKIEVSELSRGGIR